MKSRTALLIEAGKFEIQEREVTAKSDEVLVKVAVCGLCDWEKGFFTGAFPSRPSMTLGHEWAGVVCEVGSDVTTLNVGDKVAILPDRLSGFSQYSAVKASNCFKLNSTVDVSTVLPEPLKEIITVVRSAAPEAGDFAVVVGCGARGLWCIQALSSNLLAGLIAIDTDDYNLSLAKKYGATYTINAKNEDIKEAVTRITNGHMADFVIEGSKQTSFIEPSGKLLRKGRGRLVLMSEYEESVKEFDVRSIAALGAIIINPQAAYSENEQEDMRRAVELINNGVFVQDDIITHKFSLDDTQAAFETLVNKPDGYIKGVVIPE